MSPEEENGRLLKDISQQVGKTHEKVVRVEERLVNLNDRVTKLDKNIDLVRAEQQNANTEIALVQQECKRRGRVISNMHRRVDGLDSSLGAVDDTSRIFLAKTTQTWKVVTVVGAVFTFLTGIVIAIVKLGL